MDPRVDATIEDLMERGRRRGFVMMAEIHLELEAVEAPGSAVDRTVGIARKVGIEVMEGRSDAYALPRDIDENAPLHDSIRMYFNEIGRVPLLTARQEVELAMAIEAGASAAAGLAEMEAGARAGSEEERMRLFGTVRMGKEAETRLVESNLRLVVSIARRYLGNGVPLLDLIQEGNCGLLKAVERFDYRKGFKFSTYATWWIRQAVSRAVADQSRTIRVPIDMVDTIYKLSAAKRRLFQVLDREPSIKEIANEMDLPPGRVAEISKIAQGTLSLDMSASHTEQATLADFVPDREAEAPVESASLRLLEEYVALALEGLTERERQIILMRFGLGDGRVRTLKEMSGHFEVTRERIRQLETRALFKLRHHTGSRHLVSFLRDA